jgi:hypothetical protein
VPDDVEKKSVDEEPPTRLCGKRFAQFRQLVGLRGGFEVLE